MYLHLMINKKTKTGKAYGIDGLAAKHFTYTDVIIHIHLSFFSCCMFEVYLSHCLDTWVFI